MGPLTTQSFHNFLTSSPGLIVSGLLIAVVGALIGAPLDRKLVAWQARRSLIKRKKTINQLKDTIELLRPYYQDSHRLLLHSFIAAFLILGLYGLEGLCNALFGFLAFIPALIATIIAIYWLRLLFRVARFEEYKKEIELRIAHLESQESISRTIPHPLESPVRQDWNQTCSQPGVVPQPWIIAPNALEIDSPYIGANAYYIWNKAPITTSLHISFDCTFYRNQESKPDFPDLRLVLFGKSPNETYALSPQLLLHIPWELRDELFAAVVGTGTAKDVGPRGTRSDISWGKTAYYEITVGESIKITIDNETKFHILQSDVLAAGVKVQEGWFWGFSTVGGHLRISNIVIAMQ